MDRASFQESHQTLPTGSAGGELLLQWRARNGLFLACRDLRDLAPNGGEPLFDRGPTGVGQAFPFVPLIRSPQRGGDLVELPLRDRVELVVVAAAAIDRQSQEGLA